MSEMPLEMPLEMPSTENDGSLSLTPCPPLPLRSTLPFQPVVPVAGTSEDEKIARVSTMQSEVRLLLSLLSPSLSLLLSFSPSWTVVTN